VSVEKSIGSDVGRENFVVLFTASASDLQNLWIPLLKHN